MDTMRIIPDIVYHNIFMLFTRMLLELLHVLLMLIGWSVRKTLLEKCHFLDEMCNFVG